MGQSARIAATLWAAWAVGVVGCATCPKKIQHALSRPAEEQGVDVFHDYTLGCPDKIVVAAGRHLPPTAAVIEPDGCAALGPLGRVRIQGVTPSEVAEAVAGQMKLAPEVVSVEVSEFASKSILLIGPVDGAQRVISYRGPESVTELLRRTGGLAPGTAFNSIHVVRPHVAVGRRPEVFPVDLAAIVLKGDARTDVRLEPYDQVYLGETRGANIVRSLPPWVRPFCPRLKAIDTPAPSEKNTP